MIYLNNGVPVIPCTIIVWRMFPHNWRGNRCHVGGMTQVLTSSTLRTTIRTTNPSWTMGWGWLVSIVLSVIFSLCLMNGYYIINIIGFQLVLIISSWMKSYVRRGKIKNDKSFFILGEVLPFTIFLRWHKIYLNTILQTINIHMRYHMYKSRSLSFKQRNCHRLLKYHDNYFLINQ